MRNFLDQTGGLWVKGALVSARWPFRIHATYDQTIARFLGVFERVNRDVPFSGLRWFFNHAETVTERNLERVRALDGTAAVGFYPSGHDGA